ncbi:hypothetical protein [Legionella jamestowniensis]|uniref:Uncharacterized protein n=2 Tax=Legionella jamestowniensis TaxID=455 RepID=A0A0W0UK10_9GAMM|nr:hypothetical protein [Legionella jamestowniensis]KTD07958.1 hypothetical protein Ljam_2153 [Legionella jamestowniensis]SFL64660.1 hypothetical protein SAMN02746073_1279 [Legionella jamestowniensis DSM 19215]
MNPLALFFLEMFQLMNQRLVWNFEINTTPLLDIKSLPHYEKEDIKWEARYFWSHHEIICLTGLDDSFLDLRQYEIKHREDHYLLLTDNDFNIKKRREELQYKPLLQEQDNIRGFGKKIDLYHASSPVDLQPDMLHKKGKQVTVCKITLIHKFPTVPSVKLELARLCIQDNVFFSTCIEGRSKTLVTHIAKHLLPGHVSCDYVSFLKQFVKP